MTYAPRNKISINGNYTLPIDAKYGTINVGMTFTHTDAQHTTYSDVGIPAQVFLPSGGIGNTTDAGLIPAIDLLDLNASWKGVLGSPVDLSAFATNVTGKKYYAGVQGLLGLGFEVGQLGAPRIFGMRAKIHF